MDGGGEATLTSWVAHLYARDLPAFVAAHRHPQPPRRRPAALARAIHGDRAAPSYGLHSYWSKKPHELVLACLHAFTRPGDLVLDPFAGAGGLPLLAARLGRPAIALDRSPAAAFIVDALARIGPAAAIGAAVERLLADAGIAALYATRCPRCDGPAETQFAVWADVVRCGGCGGTQRRAPGVAACARCGRRLRDAARVAEELLEISGICCNGCRPARFRGPPRPADVAAALGVRARGAPAPRALFPPGIKTAELFTRGIRRVDQFFTPRNLAAMGRLRGSIDQAPEAEQPALRLAWHAALLATSLKAQHLEGGGGYLPGMYYVPPVRKERNAAGSLRRITRRLRQALAALPADSTIAPAPLHVGIGDAHDLSAIPTAAVDYVFLDPPYHGKVQYSELNFLWEAWLGADDDWRADDLVVNAARGQTLESWYAGMARVVRECARVCKPGGWLSLTYVPSGGAAPDRLWRLLEAAGFVRQTRLDGLVVNRQRTYVQRTSRATAVDRVVHFQRTR